MSQSARAERKAKIMAMSARGPTLLPIPTRAPPSFFDSRNMNHTQKAKCLKLIDEMLATESIDCFNAKDYFNILAILRERRCALTRQNNLTECIKIDDLMAQLSDYFFENKLYTSKAQEVAAIEAQLEAVKNKLSDAEEKWRKDMMRKFTKKERDENAKRNLTIENLQKYDSKIEKELPPEYCKVSPATLELHERERHLSTSRRFREAEKVHQEFEKAQKKDLAQKRQDYYKSFEKRREVVVSRNSKIISANETDWERKISHSEFLKDKEIQALVNSVSFLEAKLMRAKSEYIGEDDPIIREDDLKNSLHKTTRDLPPKPHKVPTKQMAETMYKQSRKLDSARWPPKPRT